MGTFRTDTIYLNNSKTVYITTDSNANLILHDANGNIPVGDIATITTLNAQFERNISYLNGEIDCIDYMKNTTIINEIITRNIATLQYSRDNKATWNDITLPFVPTLTLVAGDIYWRISFTGSNTDAYLGIYGTKQ
jgi:hypothetical protein